MGEVGLDFSPAGSDAAGNQAQVRALTRICEAAAVGDVHFHPIEPRSFRVTLITRFN